VLPAELAELIALQSIRVILFIFVGRIVPLLASGTCQINNFTHSNPRYSSLVIYQSYEDFSLYRSTVGG
jgi:hypothetical protein